MEGLPPTWSIILAIITLFFGGTGGILWSIRREHREAKAEPAEIERRRLENQKAAEEIAEMLRDAQRDAMDEMRGLLTTARQEASAAREEASAARQEAETLRRELTEVLRDQSVFRNRVEELLKAHGISIPDWWHT